MGSIFISEKACAPLRTALEETGHTIYTVKSSDVVYDAISSHPDIYMCKINNVLVIDDSIVMEPDLRRVYMEELERKSDDLSETPIIPVMRPKDSGGYIVFEMGGIGYEYPFDIAYNAAVTERFLYITQSGLLRRCWIVPEVPAWRLSPSDRGIRNVPV